MLDRIFKTRRDVGRGALLFRQRAIRALLDAITARSPGGELGRELDAARRRLLSDKYEVDEALRRRGRPSAEQVEADAARRRRQLRLLKGAVRERVRQIEAFAAKLEAQGDYRQASVWRAQLVFVGENVCREFAIDPGLLGDVELELTAPPDAPRQLLQRARGVPA